MSNDPDHFRLTDASIRLDSMPVAGRDVEIVPDEAERAVLAEKLGVSSVDRLEVRLHAVKFRGGMRVTGRLAGAVTQPSVVTLEPIVQEIAEPIDRVFLPGGEKEYAVSANAEIFVDDAGGRLEEVQAEAAAERQAFGKREQHLGAGAAREARQQHHRQHRHASADQR